MGLRLISLLGLVVFIALAWVLSKNRRLFPWRTVIAGILLQFALAIFILHTGPGLSIFRGTQNVISKLNDFSNEGAGLAFGALAKRDVLGPAFGPENSFIFAVSISATIIFVSALSALLYHWGVLQRVVGAMAWVMRRIMRTSGSESLATASNIFLGQTEAALLVKPYIGKMTSSEIMALMTSGMATIATGVMVVYPLLGIDAGHLLTASVLSAPAALLIAKVMHPETERSETASGASHRTNGTDVNTLDALCRGTSEGVMLAINVMAMLIAFVAVVALLNAVIAGVQTWVGIANPLTLQTVLGWLNAPFAWLMGIPWQDCGSVGQALGERLVLNEFFGYMSLSKLKPLPPEGFAALSAQAQWIGSFDWAYLGASMNPAYLEKRSFTLATYALCGFANFSSIAIQIGGIGALAPHRRHDLARLGFRSMIGGAIACYITATVVGILAD